MSTEGQEKQINSNESLKLAIAMGLLRSKLLQKPTDHHHPPSDALKWRRKAKERKQQILRLKEDLKAAEDGLNQHLLPQSAACKCYFFDNLGKLSPRRSGDDFDLRFSDVLRRRFLRQVRLKEIRKRRTDSSTQRDYNNEDDTEQLKASVDFLVELNDTVSTLDDTNCANWSHQAVDFILAAVKNLLSAGNIEVEGIISNLILRLVNKMCTTQGDGEHQFQQFQTDAQFYIQHLLRKLGSEPCIGQRVILAVSQRISLLTENLLFMDPFDGYFPDMHSSMYIMIQLIEFLVSDNLAAWLRTGGFNTSLSEEWIMSILHARKGLELFEIRNGLYVLHMDRVIGEVARHVSQITTILKLKPDIIANILR